MLVLVVKKIRRAPPVRHREIQITLVARRRVKPHPRRRRHEQRIAPRPLLLRLVVRLREIQARARRTDWPESRQTVRASAQSFSGRGRANKVRRRSGRCNGRRRDIFAARVASRSFRPSPASRRGISASPEIPASAIMPASPAAASSRSADWWPGLRQLPVRHALHRGENGVRRDVGRKAAGMVARVTYQSRKIPTASRIAARSCSPELAARAIEMAARRDIAATKPI